MTVDKSARTGAENICHFTVSSLWVKASSLYRCDGYISRGVDALFAVLTALPLCAERTRLPLLLHCFSAQGALKIKIIHNVRISHIRSIIYDISIDKNANIIYN